MSIPEIGVSEVQAPQIIEAIIEPPKNIPTYAPVTSTLAPPNLIFEIPGCVEAHIDAGNNKVIGEDDPRGVKTFCSADMPSFYPIDFRGDKISAPVLPKTSGLNTKKPEQPKAPTIPSIPTPKIPCPIPGQSIPIGGLNKAQNKIVVGYEIRNGRCEHIFEPLPLPEVIGNHLPGAPIVVTTVMVASAGVFGATLGKPIGDWVVKKVAKPVIKKVKAKIMKALKKEKILSTSEKRKLQRSLKK